MPDSWSLVTVAHRISSYDIARDPEKLPQWIAPEIDAEALAPLGSP